MDTLRSLFLSYVTTSTNPSVGGFLKAARSENFTEDFAKTFLSVVKAIYPNLYAVLA